MKRTWKSPTILAALLAMTFGMCLCVPCFAQTTAPADGAQAPADIDWTALLATVPGIALVTGLIVQGVKKYLAKVPALKDVPIWAYNLAVSIGLCLIATYVLGVLKGDIAHLLVNVIGNTLVTAAGYTILTGLGKTPATASGQTQASGGGAGWTKVSGVILLGVLLATAGGCGGQLSDGQVYIMLRDSQDVTCRAIAKLDDAGMLPLEDSRRCKAVALALDEVLDRMKDAIIAGDKSKMPTLSYTVNKLLDELIRTQLEAQAREAGKETKNVIGSNTDAGAGGGPGNRRGGTPDPDGSGREPRSVDVRAGGGDAAGQERTAGAPGGQRPSRGPREPVPLTALIEQEWD